MGFVDGARDTLWASCCFTSPAPVGEEVTPVLEYRTQGRKICPKRPAMHANKKFRTQNNFMSLFMGWNLPAEFPDRSIRLNNINNGYTMEGREMQVQLINNDINMISRKYAFSYFYV
jgi:hypothetical protein